MNWTPADLESLSPDLYDELITWFIEQHPTKRED